MIFSKRLLPGVVAWFLLSFPLHAASPIAVASFTLSNGMQVVLLENHRVPVITHMIWYRVGAADDYPGRSGLAHYNEHMMFQGTEKTAGGEFVHIVTSHGGKENAFTGHDYTGYYVSIAKERLPLVMELEADRMLHLAPTEANFAKEREVIIEERRMTIENQPEALLTEEMQAALYRNHPYHNPLIGWMHEMEALSRVDVLDFHRQFYHPANAVLIVAGDITSKELQALAEHYYGVLPAGEKYVRHWRAEPPQRGPRHIEMRHENVNEPELLREYIAPSVNVGDKTLVIPTYVLAQILGGGPTSRLYQSLVVRQKLATSVDMDYSGLNVGPGELEISLTPAKGVTLNALEAALDKEIDAIGHDTVPEEELSRAKTLLKAEIIFARDGTENLARIVGTLVMVGLPPEYINQWSTLIDGVKANDLHKAMQNVFDTRGSVTGYLLPDREKTDAAAARPPAQRTLPGKAIQ